MQDDDSVKRAILGFAQLLVAQPVGETPQTLAQRLGWIGESGRPTQDGIDLFQALFAQRETRGIFRNVV